MGSLALGLLRARAGLRAGRPPTSWVRTLAASCRSWMIGLRPTQALLYGRLLAVNLAPRRAQHLSSQSVGRCEQQPFPKCGLRPRQPSLSCLAQWSGLQASLPRVPPSAFGRSQYPSSQQVLELNFSLLVWALFQVQPSAMPYTQPVVFLTAASEPLLGSYWPRARRTAI